MMKLCALLLLVVLVGAGCTSMEARKYRRDYMGASYYYDIVNDSDLYKVPIPPRNWSPSQGREYKKGHLAGWRFAGYTHYWAYTKDKKLVFLVSNPPHRLFGETAAFRTGFLDGQKQGLRDVDTFGTHLKQKLGIGY